MNYDDNSGQQPTPSPPPPPYNSYMLQRHRRRQRERSLRRRQQQQQPSVTVIYPPSPYSATADDNDSNTDSNVEPLVYPQTTAVTVLYPERVVLNGLQAISFQSPLPLQQQPIDDDSTPPFYEEHFSCSPPPILILAVSLIQCILFGILNSLDSLPSPTRHDVPCIYEAFSLSWHSWLHQPWRLVTYAFLHNDVWHLLFTVGSQAVLGVCLELVHTWRILAIYFAGILGGAFGYLIFSYAKYYYLMSSSTGAAGGVTKEYLDLLPEAIIIGSSSGCYALLACQFVNFALNYRRMVMASVQLVALIVYAVIEVLAQVLYYQPNGFIQQRVDTAASGSDNDLRPPYYSVVVRPGVLSRNSLWRLDEYDDDSTYYDLILRALNESREPANAVLNESTACHVFGALAGFVASVLLLKRVAHGDQKTKTSPNLRRPLYFPLRRWQTEQNHV